MTLHRRYRTLLKPTEIRPTPFMFRGKQWSGHHVINLGCLLTAAASIAAAAAVSLAAAAAAVSLAAAAAAVSLAADAASAVSVGLAASNAS